MTTECLRNYENDEIERKKIIEFQQTYSSDTCIRWYTSDTFLYRLLNKALRTQNINDIFKYRFYIKDLYQQLENLSTASNTIIPTMYRGQMITREELEKLQENINGLISVNTFFSTTLSSSAAADFSGSGMGRPQFESVVFQITINQKRLTKPFADIHRYSCNTHEKEILFSMGTTFRIDTVELFIDDIWLVKLTLNEEEDKNLNDLITHFKKEINETKHHLLTLGKFLYFMGDLDKAERYYRLVFDQILSSILCFDDDYYRNHMIATLYNNLGLIYHARENFQVALENYQNALKIHLSQKPMDPFANTTIYNNIANTLIDMGDYQKALEMYNTALELRLLYSSFIEDDSGLAQIYNNLAVCYNQNGQYTHSIENYEKSIHIKLKYLPSNHPSLGIAYSNLGNIHRANSNYEMALKYCQKALDIHILTLPKDHIDLAKTYNALATIYTDIGNFIKAKENYEKALEIVLNQTPQKYLLLTTIYNNIANIHLNECQYDLVMKYYKRALEKIESSDMIGHAVIYNNLGEIYRKIGDYTEALIHHKKSN
jgi:tetratricopeptide (TPR) repeat protein